MSAGRDRGALRALVADRVADLIVYCLCAFWLGFMLGAEAMYADLWKRRRQRQRLTP